MQLIIHTNDKALPRRQLSQTLSINIEGTVPQRPISTNNNQERNNAHASSDDLEVRQRHQLQDLQLKAQNEHAVEKPQDQQFKKQLREAPIKNAQDSIASDKGQKEQFKKQMFMEAPFNNTQKFLGQARKQNEQQFKPQMFLQAPFNNTDKLINQKIIDVYQLKNRPSSNEPQNQVFMGPPPTNIQNQHINELHPSKNNFNSPQNALQPDVIVEGSHQKTRQAIRIDRVQEKAEVEEQLQPITTASEQASEKVNRIIGVIILVGMFLVLWVYGWASEYRVISSANSSTILLFSSSFIITAIFTVIGFGMLFMHFKRMSESAFFVSLFITSLTIIISPLMQKFWYNIFITDFNDTTISASNNSYLLNQSMGGKNIYIDFYNLKFTLICAISQLTALLGLFGRINFMQMTLFSIFYNFAWALNHYLIISRLNSAPDSRIFDDYQIASVYLFAGMFGVISSLIVKKPPLSQGFLHSNFSAMFAQIGTFFLFLSFCSNTILFAQKNTSTTLARTYVWQQGFINSFFALSSSVICTYLGSVLLGEKIHVRQSVIGTISGAIIFGSVAQICTNIGAAIACGCFSGLFSAVFYQKIYKKINRRQIFDSFGSIFIAIISLISTLGVAPIVVYVYYYYNFYLQTLKNAAGTSNTAITAPQLPVYMLEYVGITAGIGFCSGLVIGLIMKIFDRFDADKTFDDKLYISKSSGLKAGQKKFKQESKDLTNINIQKKRSKVQIQAVQSQKEMIGAIS